MVCVEKEDLSDSADVLADLSHHCMHVPKGPFSHDDTSNTLGFTYKLHAG